MKAYSVNTLLALKRLKLNGDVSHMIIQILGEHIKKDLNDEILNKQPCLNFLQRDDMYSDDAIPQDQDYIYADRFWRK